jgi:hypothetical protein
MKFGILGAGEIGAALARVLTTVGHQAMVSSRHPDTLRNAAAEAGYSVGSLDDSARFGEMAIAALPFRALDAIPVGALAGKIVVDTMNYYPDRDGVIAALAEHRTTTSEMVAAHLAQSKIVKAFNAILAYDLPFDDRPAVTSGRRALPIAGDDAEAKAVVVALCEQLDFDVLDAGPLINGWRFERAKPAYCIPLNGQDLRQALAAARRDHELPHGSWRRRPRP